MRNHGFVRESGRWRLSPAFDVNPNTDLAKTHTTDHVHDAVQTSPGLSDEVKVMETDLHAEAVSALRAAR